MGSGRSLWAHVQSACRPTEPPLQSMLSSTFKLFNPALLLRNRLLAYPVKWGQKGVSLKEVSAFIPISQSPIVWQHTNSGNKLHVCKTGLGQGLSLWQVITSPGRFSGENWILGFCDLSVAYGQVHPMEPKSIIVFEGYVSALEFWLGMALVISIHFVLGPIAYFIFIRHLVKEKWWGKVTCTIHVHGSHLWICFAGYNFFFFQGFVWIECPFHVDFSLES